MMSRADDDRMLLMLRLHVVGGLTARQIAKRMKTTPGSVSGTIHRVRLADQAEGGEPKGAIAKYYSRGAFAGPGA